MATGRDLHIDAALSNVAVEAFAAESEFVADFLFPGVPVSKESDKYYTIDKASWFRTHQTLRARRTAPREIEFNVSSDSYFCDNHALREGLAREDLDNADQPILLRERATLNVVEAIRRGKEVKVAGLATSITNVGSGVRNSTAGTRWSDVLSADIMGQVNTAHAFIMNQTGLAPNICVIDWHSWMRARSNTRLFELVKYSASPRQDSRLTGDQLRDVFAVDRVIVAKAIYNKAPEGQTASLVPVWGKNAVFAYVDPRALSTRTKTFGLTFQWRRPGFPGPQYTRRYPGSDEGKQVEFVESGYYHDEKIVASDLAYVIETNSGSPL